MKPKSPFDNLNKLANKAVENGWFKSGEKNKAEEKQSEKLSMKEAFEIIGDENFYGPMEIFKTLGISVENMTIPEIQFSKSELEQAKVLGQELILYVDKDQDGNPLIAERIRDLCNENKTSKNETFISSNWFEANSFGSSETPRLGWRLSGREPFIASANEDYIGQTREIINYLTEVIFKKGIPSEYEEAIQEFDMVKKSLYEPSQSPVVSEWRPAAEKLANLKINQLCRENFTEVLYRLALHEKKTGERLLDSSTEKLTCHTWTNSLDWCGRIVDVGNFNYSGVSAEGWSPRQFDETMGVCFSRS